MANLLDMYNDMLNDEQAQEEEILEKTAEEQLANDRIEILTKYATLADNMLAEEYGDDYEEADVQELASYLIENDAAIEEQQEKIAEYHQLGTIMAKAFKAELEAGNEEEAEEEEEK